MVLLAIVAVSAQEQELVNWPKLKINMSYSSNLTAGTFSRSGLDKALYSKPVSDLGSEAWAW